MNNSASLTPVQGPSTVACMILTSLSQLSHWLHQGTDAYALTQKSNYDQYLDIGGTKLHYNWG